MAVGSLGADNATYRRDRTFLAGLVPKPTEGEQAAALLLSECDPLDYEWVERCMLARYPNSPVVLRAKREREEAERGPALSRWPAIWFDMPDYDAGRLVPRVVPDHPPPPG